MVGGKQDGRSAQGGQAEYQRKSRVVLEPVGRYLGQRTIYTRRRGAARTRFSPSLWFRRDFVVGWLFVLAAPRCTRSLCCRLRPVIQYPILMASVSRRGRILELHHGSLPCRASEMIFKSRCGWPSLQPDPRQPRPGRSRSDSRVAIGAPGATARTVLFLPGSFRPSRLESSGVTAGAHRPCQRFPRRSSPNLARAWLGDLDTALPPSG
jgi:hypothetical protein